MRSTSLRLVIPILFSIALIAAATIAAGDDEATPARPEPGQQLLLHHADADHDGVVTAAEWQAMSDHISAVWQQLDEDGDGNVAIEHGFGPHAFAGHAGGRAGGRRFARMMRRHARPIIGGMMLRAADLAGNDDGTLERAEWTDFLAQADTDGDGTLGRDELRETLRETLRAERPEPPPAPTIDALAERFDQLDGDHDGILSADELAQGRRQGGRHHR